MNEKIRAFLDTNILLRYYDGDVEIAKLFDKEALEKTRYSISPIVVQELLLTLDKKRMGQVDLEKLSNWVDIISNEDMIEETNRSTELSILRWSESNLHVNDYLNLFAARRNRCNFFVTNDRGLLSLHDLLAMQLAMEIVTPDAFLQLESVA